MPQADSVGSSNSSSVGIDDIAMYIPRLFLDMRDFAELRGIDYNKLNKGLGLSAMAIPDVHEDPATMGANAAASLIDSNGLDPKTIGRIYLGTESALDGAKPTATYIMDMLEQKYANEFGAGSFRHCDVVDLTFACIGAVDALHNTVDWVARGGVQADRIGIVVFADHAKYDLESNGEYTQGAGAGAILIRHNPRLLSIADIWGVATTPVHDFFKPRRTMTARSVVTRVVAAAEQCGVRVEDGLVDEILQALSSASENNPLFENDNFMLHKDTPVFDGQFSNRCYAESVTRAFADFADQAVDAGRYDPEHDSILSEQWARIVVHLPYAFQAKRMLPDIFRYDRKHLPLWAEVESEIGAEPQPHDFADTVDCAGAFENAQDQYRRLIANTQLFGKFVQQKLEKSQRASSLVGNLYTGSIFLALMSVLESDYLEKIDLSGQTIGMCGYGSGAKAKVFEGEVQSGWQKVAAKFHLFKGLANRCAIDAAVYESLHRGVTQQSVVAPQGEFVLVSVGAPDDLEGQRRYAWVD
jgi:hydroxymethylglutaryl-CoA synthase